MVITMSEYKDLIERLRGKPPTNSTLDRYEAADVIAAQAKRIAELEAALKPFLDNDWWEQIDWTDKTEREVWVTMADLRAARKVLGEKE